MLESASREWQHSPLAGAQDYTGRPRFYLQISLLNLQPWTICFSSLKVSPSVKENHQDVAMMLVNVSKGH